VITHLLHRGVYWFQALRRSVWFFTEPRTVGVHGIPITSDGKIVLVKLSYAHGWRLPGGGQRAGEDPAIAMLRELREEIGLTGHGSVELVTGFSHRPDHRRGEASLFVVRGVHYRPRWSLEVSKVGEFHLDALPADTAKITHRLLALAADHLPAGAGLGIG
jgi:8-oxo-dGTP pyrophosphatase MutT (NUDIX family)